MSKLWRFIDQIRSANGPAQLVGYSAWGVILAGMLWNYAPDYLHQELLLMWGLASAIVVPVAIWANKRVLQYVLMLDMVLSMLVLALYSMYDPQFATEITYRVDNSGMIGGKLVHDLSCWFTQLGLFFMTAHSAYLANLTQRQILESRRFHDGH